MLLSVCCALLNCNGLIRCALCYRIICRSGLGCLFRNRFFSCLFGCIGILFSCIGGLICALPFMKQSASPDWVNYYAFWYPPLIAVAVFVLGILTVRNAKNAPLPGA